MFHITKDRVDNSLKKIRGALRPFEQIIYRNDPLGAKQIKNLRTCALEDSLNLLFS